MALTAQMSGTPELLGEALVFAASDSGGSPLVLRVHLHAVELGNGNSVTFTCWLAVPLSPLSSTTVNSTA